MEAEKNTLEITIIVDGLGWEHMSKVPVFKSILPFQKPLKTVLGFSSSAIPTLLTGKSAEDHGMWNLFKVVNEEDSDFPLFKMDILRNTQNKYMRKAGLVINKKVANFNGYYQVYDIPAWKLPRIKICESKNIYSLNGIPGSDTLLDRWDKAQRKWVCRSYKDGLSDMKILEKTLIDIQDVQLERALLYLCEFDAFGHANALNPELMLEKASDYANKISGLIQKLDSLKRPYKVNVISDHGMVPRRGEVNVRQALAKLPYKDGIDYWAVLDSTMARFYVTSPSVTEAIKESLTDLPGSFLTEEDKTKYKIRFNGQYGEILWMIDTGLQIVPSDMGRISCNGMHGYEPSDPEMLASLGSTERISNDVVGIWDYYKSVN
jgi:predicted AlkP superfamily pyrophosphatase or phosphodiesterase